MKKYIPGLMVILLCIFQPANADWKDMLNKLKQAQQENNTGLSDETIVNGLKQALNQGVDASIKQLGRSGGFMNDPTVKIPMPASLTKVEKGLRKIRQDKYADKFILTMNQAAEKAVPVTVDIMVQAVKAMSVKDAVNILKGKDDAATQYFKQHSSPGLRSAIKPLVQNATSSVGVTDAYKKMIGKAGFLASYMDKDSLDIDQYITEQAIEGLFIKIAIEEKRIRDNPVARTTDILKTVFAKQ